jgi:hypothetical protein
MPDDLSAAITSAVADATSEVTPDSTPEPDKPASTTEAAPEPTTADAKPSPAPAAEPAEPDEEEFFSPTAEELAAIEADPRLKKVYLSMRRGFTKKTTEIAAERKRLAQEHDVAEWIRNDPEAAIRSIATATGVSLGQAREIAAEAVEADPVSKLWIDGVGTDAASILRPIIEQTIDARIGPKVRPLEEATQAANQAAMERGIAASIREFGASVTERGEEWDDDLQQDMAQIANSVNPGPQTTFPEFISAVYDAAVARRMRTKSARSNLERLRRARTEAEPTNVARPSPKSEETITNDMSDNDAVAIAVRQASRQVNR